MLFLEYLFFKFYFFQVKVGEDVDIAPYTTLMCLCLIFEFIFVDILGICSFFMPSINYYLLPNKYVVILMLVLFFILLYFLLVRKNKYERILKKHEAEWKGKKNFGATLFAILPFVIFFTETYNKMLMNQGKL